MIIDGVEVVFSVVSIDSCVVVCAGFDILTICGAICFLYPWCLYGTELHGNGYMTVAVMVVRI